MNDQSKWAEEKKLYNTIKDDISEGNFKNDISKDFEELKEFFLNDDRKKKLAGMGSIKKFFFMTWWLLSELLLKLTPTRRLLLLLGILTIFVLRFRVENFEANTNLIGSILILFVLMLELKDKLLAKDELSAGNSVQTALMPRKNHKIPGWDIWLFTQPAKEVGGDLVDIIKLKDSKYGITIADISGKGLPAALLMAKLQTIIRTLAPEISKLDFLFSHVNNVFHRDIFPNSFASAIFFEIEENENLVNYVNAGHLPPLLLKGGEIKEFPKGNIALGLKKDSYFKVGEFIVNSDEYFLAFSDGVTEARNEEGELLGLDRLNKFIKGVKYSSPKELGEKILNMVDDFIGSEKKYDDLSIVVIKRV